MRNMEYNYISGFCDRLSELMSNAKMSAQKLGNIVCRERKTIYSWLNGNGIPNAVCLMKICAYFNVSADWLLFGGNVYGK